jgi:hypothetical protein
MLFLIENLAFLFENLAYINAVQLLADPRELRTGCVKIFQKYVRNLSKL